MLIACKLKSPVPAFSVFSFYFKCGLPAETSTMLCLVCPSGDRGSGELLARARVQFQRNTISIKDLVPCPAHQLSPASVSVSASDSVSASGSAPAHYSSCHY